MHDLSPVIIALSSLAAVAPAATAPAAGAVIDFGSLLREMRDLAGLARLPEPAFTTVQHSSYDRRSTAPDAPDWYANADGFGREPVPGFLAVLDEPGEDGVGRWLLADEEGPGAIVRGWSARMGGVLRVVLDGADEPLYEGPAYDFLADRTRVFLEQAGVILDCGDAFRQQDADYLPVPYERSLRVTWEGTLEELHFYHLEVRRYPAGTAVRTFDPSIDLAEFGPQMLDAVEGLTRPAPVAAGALHESSVTLAPDEPWTWATPGDDRSGAITELALRLDGADAAEALRGTLLRIAFDGAHRPQVESPVGDFFGSAPGVNPFESLPMSVAPDGTMTCRFVMPFQRGATVTLLNTTDGSVRAEVSVRVAPREWDERSLHFRAHWRSDTDLDLRFGPFDLPFVMALGAGRLVGAASLLANPSGVPHPYGSWWGEGDEKILVDGEAFPSFYGTGSEDYYNYSWSRPDLFDHPYCGQPLDTGPGNAGYCSNHRWHVLDSVPFTSSLAFWMEMWHHAARPGLGYARIAYLYARPGAVDDHRRVQLSELTVPPLPAMEPEAHHGAQGATFHHFEDARLVVKGGATGVDVTLPTASRGRLVMWGSEAGATLSMPFEIETAREEVRLNLVAAHRPDGGIVRVLLDGKPLVVENRGGAEFGRDGEERLILRSRHALRLLSTRFRPVSLEAGEHELTIECVEQGRFGFDYVWVK